MHFIFAKILSPHIDPSVAATFVLAIATLEIGIFKIVQGYRNFNITKNQFFLFCIIGILVGASTYIDYEAVSYIDPGTAAVVFQSSIFFGLIFGIFSFTGFYLQPLFYSSYRLYVRP